MRVNERMKKVFSILLCLCMVLQYVPTTAFAIDAAESGLCEHHAEHTAECGYAEAVEGQPCAHVHDELCGHIEAVAEVKCACEATDENGALVHTEGCGYVAPVEGSNCTHVHDEACGYVAAVEAHECHYACDECAAKETTEPSTESAPVCDCGTDDALIHATTCPVYVAPENPQCYCAEKCTEANVWCDICGFDYAKCGGTDRAVGYDGHELESGSLKPGAIIISTSGEDSGIRYLILSEPASTHGTVSVYGHNGVSGEITIPGVFYVEQSGTYQFYVTAIEANAFQGCSDLTSVMVQQGTDKVSIWESIIKTIGDGAFKGTQVQCATHRFTASAACDVCDYVCGHAPSENAVYTVNDDGTHSYTCTICSHIVTEEHTIIPETGKCICGVYLAVAYVDNGSDITYFDTVEKALTECQENSGSTLILLEELEELNVNFSVPYEAHLEIGSKYPIGKITVQGLIRLAIMDKTEVSEISLEYGKLVLDLSKMETLHKCPVTAAGTNTTLTVLAPTGCIIYDEAGNVSNVNDRTEKIKVWVHSGNLTIDTHDWTGVRTQHTLRCPIDGCDVELQRAYSYDEYQSCLICGARQPYAITVNPTENGTVTADPFYSYGSELITLTVDPDDGYVTKSLEVFYQIHDGAEEASIADHTITPTPVADQPGKYTFTMPNANVYVNADFAVCDHSESEHTTATSNDEGKHSFTCTLCGGTGTEDHTYENGSCICGAEDPAVFNPVLDISKGSITVADGMITQSSTYENQPYSGVLTITGTSESYTVTVGSGNHKIVLQDCKISSTPGAAFSVAYGATVDLTLMGTNTLRSGAKHAGLEVSEGAQLIINGSGSLTAAGGASAAGIGGGCGENGGIITINSGTVTATGGQYGSNNGGGAGIGSGANTSSQPIAGGTITINGGKVTATGGAGSGALGSGAGIGGGGGSNSTWAGTAGNVTITGGTVIAAAGTGANGAPTGFDIGRGGKNSTNQPNTGAITITGGNIKASVVFPTPKDTSGNALTPVTITLDGATVSDKPYQLFDSAGETIAYNISDSELLDNSKLYVYLPVTDMPAVYSVIAGEYQYTNSANAWDGGSSSGYSATFTRGDTKYDYTDVRVDSVVSSLRFTYRNAAFSDSNQLLGAFTYSNGNKASVTLKVTTADAGLDIHANNGSNSVSIPLGSSQNINITLLSVNEENLVVDQYVQVGTISVKMGDEVLAEVPVEVMLVKVAPQVTPPTAKTLTYTGKAQELVAPGETEEIASKMEYSLDNENWSTAIPTGTDAGEYTVYYRVPGNLYFTEIAPESVAVSIQAKEVTAPTFEDIVVQSAEPLKIDFKLMDGDAEIPASEYTVSYSKNTTPGTATITVTDKAGGNYIVSGTATVAYCDHSEHAGDYEVTADTHSFTCTVCGAAITEESHKFIDGTCSCGTPATYTVTVTESGSQGGNPYLTNTEKATHGRLFDTAIKMGENVDAWYTDVVKVKVGDRELVKGEDYTYNPQSVYLIIFNTSVTGPIEIFAQVNAKVTFELNGGDVESSRKEQLAAGGLNVIDGKIDMPLAYGVPSSFGSTLEALNQIFLREGYSCTGLKNGDKDADLSAPVENCTLTVQWEANTYSVTWIVDGSTSTTTQTYDAALALPTAPEKEDCGFLGWFTAEEGGEQVTAETIFQNANNSTVYYAHWCDHGGENPTYVDGKCGICGYVCTHKTSQHDSYTDLTDTTHTFLCTVCGQTIQEEHSYDTTTHRCDCGQMEPGWYTVTYPNFIELEHCVGMAVSPDVAQAGTTVTVKVEMEDGYSFEGMAVTAADRTKISYTTEKTGYITTMTFEMPEQNVKLLFAKPSVFVDYLVEGLVYTGEERSLIQETEVSNGTLQFSLDGDIWTEEWPKGTNAGTYPFAYRVLGDEGYMDLDPVNTHVRIGKAEGCKITGDITVVNNFANTYTFDLSGYAPTFGSWGDNIKYTPDAVSFTGSGYYTSGAKIEDNKLILPVNKVESTEVGTVGTVTVKITSQNFEESTLTLTVNRINHAHVWNYSANEATKTITAKCANADGYCSDAEQSFTLNAPDVGYSGNPVEAEVTRDGTDLTYTLRYTGTNYDSADAPTNAGDYTVTMTVGDKSVSDTFTISPKNIANCTVSLSESRFVYSGKAPVLTVSAVDNGVGSTTLAKDTDYTVGTVQVNAGSHKLTVTGKGNYIGTVELDYTITAKEVSIIGAAIQAVTYDPDGHTLTVTGVTFDGVVDGETLAYTAEATLGNTNAVGEQDATVTVTLNNSNYTLEDATYETTVTINKAEPEIVWNTGYTNSYGKNMYITAYVNGVDGEMIPGTAVATVYDANGNALNSVTCTKTDSIGTYFFNWLNQLSDGTYLAAESYVVELTYQGNENYNAKTVELVTYTIAKADPMIGTVGCEMDLYDSTAISNVELTRTDMSVDGTLVLTDSELTAGEGTYNWKFTPKDTDNYNTITGNVVLNVTADVLEKIEASGTLEKDSYSYGDTFSIDGLTVTATYTSGATKDVTGLVSFDSTLAVGQTSVELTYQGKTCTVTGFTVAKKQLVIDRMAWDIPENAVYSGTAYNATLTGNLPEGVTVTKTGDTATNAGDYTAKAVFSLAEGYSADNYEIVNGEDLTADWSIAKKNIADAEITLGAALTYNGEQQTKTVASVKIDGLTVTYTVSGNTGTDAKGYTLTVTGNGNFKGTATADWSIAKKNISGATISLGDSLTYIGNEQTQEVADVKIGDLTVTYDVTANKQTNAGNYTLTVTGNGNFEGSATADWSIAKAKATITVDTTTINVTYGETVTLPIATTNFGAVACDKTAADLVNAGSYTVTYTVAGTANYEGDTKTLTVIVAQKAVAEPTVTDTYTYTGSEQTVTLTGVESCMSITSGNKATNVGNYEVVITLDSNHKWADGSDGKVQWSIGNAEFGDVYVSQSEMLTYNGTAQTPEVRTDADSEGGQTATFTYRLTENESYGEMPAFTDAGTYTIYFKASAPNHNDATGSFTVTVDKAKAEITVDTNPIIVTYGDTVELPDATANFGTVTCDKTVDDLVNVGTYTVTYTIVGTDNYDGDTKTVTVTINAKVVTAADVKLNGSLTYNGKEQTQPITVTEGITYEVSGNKATNAGAYELIVEGTGNYTGSVTLDWTIAKAKLTITADSKVIYIGEKVPTLTYTASGLVGGDKLTKEPVLTTNADADQAGSYTITAANADAGDNYTITYVSGSLTIMDKETEVETKIEQTELTEVPEGLKDTQFDTVEEIKEELISKILATSTGYSAENMVHYDVALHFSLDGGDSWILATEENFPTEGITVILPYPEGTNARDYEFVVSHMFTVTSQRLGTVAAEVEMPKVEETANGIRVTLNGLSPVTVAARYHDHTGGTATCTDKAICSICGTAYGELDATNHAGGTEVKNAKEATCGAEGYTGDTHCKGCGEIVEKGAAIKATGEHTYGDWKVVKEPTKTTKGEKQRTCSVCGHVDSKEIPVLSDTPATGDNSNIMLYSSMFTVSLAGLVVLLLAAKKRKQETA